MRRRAAPSAPRRLSAGASSSCCTSNVSPRRDAPDGQFLAQVPQPTQSSSWRSISQPMLLLVRGLGVGQPVEDLAAAVRERHQAAPRFERRQGADRAVHLPDGGDELGRLAGAHREHPAALGLHADGLEQALHERDPVDGV